MENCFSIRLLNNLDEVLCKINAIHEFDEDNEFDEGEVFYIHPTKGTYEKTISNCLIGWSEESDEENLQWEYLINECNTDTDFMNKVCNLDLYIDDKVDTIDYYIYS